MERKLAALKLLLDEIRIPLSTKNINDRKDMQKAICLMQAAGIELGYKFSWYLKGPYSPALSDDYYKLAEALIKSSDQLSDYELIPSIKQALDRVRDTIFIPPASRTRLQQSDWLELVASVWFLLKVSGLSWDEAKEILNKQKEKIANDAELAREKLRKAKLLN